MLRKLASVSTRRAPGSGTARDSGDTAATALCPAAAQGPAGPRSRVPHSHQLSRSAGSDVPSHRTTYSQCSDRGAARAEASRRTPAEELRIYGFYPLPFPPKASPFLRAPAALSVPITSLESPSPLLTKRRAIPGSCCVSQCPFTCWHPHFHAFVIPRAGTSRPLVSGSHPQLNLHLHLQFAARLPGPAAFLSTSPSGFRDCWD